jgi:hypothetical protein
MVSKKKASEVDTPVPICFSSTPEKIAQFSEEHPEVVSALRKPILNLLAEVNGISKKHGVSLGFDLSFVFMEGINNGE